MKAPKPLDKVDWEEAAGHPVGIVPGASLGEVIARAEAAAVTLDVMGKTREAEATRRAAAHKVLASGQGARGALVPPP